MGLEEITLQDKSHMSKRVHEVLHPSKLVCPTKISPNLRKQHTHTTKVCKFIKSESVVFILFMIVCSFGVCSFVPSSTQKKTQRCTLIDSECPDSGTGAAQRLNSCAGRAGCGVQLSPTAKDSYTPWNYTPWNEHRMWTNYQMWINYQSSTCLSRIHQHPRVFYRPPKGPPKWCFPIGISFSRGPPIFQVRSVSFR